MADGTTDDGDREFTFALYYSPYNDFSHADIVDLDAHNVYPRSNRVGTTNTFWIRPNSMVEFRDLPENFYYWVVELDAMLSGFQRPTYEFIFGTPEPGIVFPATAISARPIVNGYRTCAFQLDEDAEAALTFTNTLVPAEPEEEYDLILRKTVETGGDRQKLFEFEIFYRGTAEHPQTARSISLTTNPGAASGTTYYVTFEDGTPMPASRIIGARNHVLLLRHGEGARVHGVPEGRYYIQEHANAGYVTAYRINADGFFTAPNGTSRTFTHSGHDTIVNCINTVTPEEPGTPEEPFEPEDPEIPREPFDPDEPEEPTTPGEPEEPTTPGTSPQTGDSRDPTIAIIMLTLGTFCIAGAEVFRRRMKKKDAKKS
jgi:hypothetical protein